MDPEKQRALSEFYREEFLRHLRHLECGGLGSAGHLDRACRNLERNRPFSYQTSTGQLCAIDTITVIEGFGGSPITGDTCGLGEFMPSDEEEVEVLKGELEPVEVEPEEVEVEVEVEETEEVK